MVAISLYKGNMHRVPPEVPRRWPCPGPKISLKRFKILIERRSKALARLRSSSSSSPTATGANPNPNPNNHEIPNTIPTINNKLGEYLKVKEEGDDDAGEKLVEKADTLPVEVKKEENVVNGTEFPKPEVEAEAEAEVERERTENGTSDQEKRIKEVKEKLEILNERKHGLVQVLKQILNAEEQLKRPNSTQVRPPLPLQVDTTTDSGSMTRVNTPRVGSDGNPCGDTDGGEADDGSNQNQSRQLLRMTSMSPSSESQLRRPASNMVPHSYRTTVGIAGSPSRFAPAGQGHSSVSGSGTSYIASSPSPAASGGTSVFRDARLPSPWN